MRRLLLASLALAAVATPAFANIPYGLGRFTVRPARAAEPEKAEKSNEPWRKVDPSVWLWTDPETGCVYVWMKDRGAGGTAIRLRNDGRPDCPGTPLCVETR